MPTGGLVQGDRISIDVVVEPGGVAHLTSQSANRAYRCDEGEIRQSLLLKLNRGAYLEWWPEPLIPYAGTRIRQDARLVVDPDSTLLFAEMSLAGRVARGERHAYQRLELRTVAGRPGGEVLFRDRLLLEPAQRPCGSLGMLGDAAALGSFYLLGPELATRLAPALAQALADLTDCAAVTLLPAESGVLVRALSPTAASLREVQACILRLARERLWERHSGESFKP
jgi:urease accessory protein